MICIKIYLLVLLYYIKLIPRACLTNWLWKQIRLYLVVIRLIQFQTSVVIHCAATVRFNDTLKSAIELNIKGVNRMIKLCKRMPKLDVSIIFSKASISKMMQPGTVRPQCVYFCLENDAICHKAPWDEMLRILLKFISNNDASRRKLIVRRFRMIIR